MKKITAFFLLFPIIFTAFGCSSENSFEFAEFKIILPEEYREDEDNKDFDLAMTDGYALIGLNRIPRYAAAEQGIPDMLKPYEFADYYMRKSGIDSEVKQKGDVPYYVYHHTPSGGDGQFRLVAFYRSEYAYFTLFLIVNEWAEEKYSEDFIDYIDNVSFIIERSN